MSKTHHLKRKLNRFGVQFMKQKNHNKNANWIKDHNKAVDELNIQQQVLSQWTSNAIQKAFKTGKCRG